ncbi:MAG: TIGR00341 family protein [Bacteroidales bacterium]|nr:TIGR00341 family protein [Bacteroidales bacterium]
MEEEKKENKEPKIKSVQKQYSNARIALGTFFTETLKIEGTDVLGTIDNIKKDMVFRGRSAWILMFSILIASIGLNANSTPVIIGAMLISPLMGPIVAIGLSVGTSDYELLKRALKNFLIAVLISLIVSTLYFWLTPLKEAKSELLARTSPTILDVMIAFFGGFAGIVAGSSRERGNVIPGVAIATALMPPLCTAGYGLATGHFMFFFGAMYLFFINSVFISLATFLTVRYMKFPRKKFLDHDREKRIKRIMAIFIILVISPSAVIFFNVIKQSRFTTNAELFVKEVISAPHSQLLNSSYEFSDQEAYINLYFIGEPVSDSTIASWMMRLPDYNLVAKKNFLNSIMLPDTTIIKVYQNYSDGQITQNELNAMNENLQKEIRVGVLEDIYQKNEEMINERDEKIKELQKTIDDYNADDVPIQQLYRELQVQYPRIEAVSFGQNIKIINDTLIDTLPTFVLKWQYATSRYYKNQQIPVLKEWLKVRFGLDTLVIVEEQ